LKAAKLMVEALEAEGVKRIFAVPGEENLDLVDAIRTSDIELILCRHELLMIALMAPPMIGILAPLFSADLPVSNGSSFSGFSPPL